MRPLTTNALALLTEKAVRIPISAVLMIFTARTLGPANFGVLAFAQAVLALCAPFAHLGFEQIVIRDLIRLPSTAPALLGTTFLARLAMGSVLLAIAVATVALVSGANTAIPLLILLATLPFASATTVDYYFRATERMILPTVVRLAAFSVYAVLTASLLFIFPAHASPGRIATLIFLEAVVVFFLYLAILPTALRPLRWSCSGKTLRALWTQSWPLMLSGISIMVYMRIDQAMLKIMLGDRNVGLYAAATTITELWYFFPVALSQAVFPRIIALHSSPARYYKFIEQFGRALVMAAYIFAVTMSIFSHQVIGLIYGPDYVDACSVLVVSAWAGVFVALGTAQGPWSVAENLQRQSLYRTASGAVANVLLNLIFIPIWGITGAAVATVISYGISAFAGNIFSPATRPFFYRQLRMLVPYAY